LRPIVHSVFSPRPHLAGVVLDPQTEAALRLLRTLLDEARAMLPLVGGETEALMLERRITHAQREAEAFVPNFRSVNLRNGASGS
jgi:hypothetical protein